MSEALRLKILSNIANGWSYVSHEIMECSHNQIASTVKVLIRTDKGLERYFVMSAHLSGNEKRYPQKPKDTK